MKRVNINGNIIPFSGTVKILGLTFGQLFTFNQHATNQTNSVGLFTHF